MKSDVVTNLGLQVTNSFGTIPGFFAPQVTDMITTADPDTEPEKLKQQWQTVFYITAAVYAFGVVFYMTFAEGELQPWADGVKRIPGKRIRTR